MGDDKVRSWLISLTISVFTSILLTQPLQVAMLTFLLVTIFKKMDENSYTAEGDDNEDDDSPLNVYSWKALKDQVNLYKFLISSLF